MLVLRRVVGLVDRQRCFPVFDIGFVVIRFLVVDRSLRFLIVFLRVRRIKDVDDLVVVVFEIHIIAYVAEAHSHLVTPVDPRLYPTVLQDGRRPRRSPLLAGKRSCPISLSSLSFIDFHFRAARRNAEVTRRSLL